jgi:crossover junction endodeoxyribonuclease RuvC
VKVLGLDPGTIATGFGIVVFESGHLCLERCGVWRPPSKLEFPAKLDFLFGALLELLAETRPVAVSVETVFAARHVA